MHWHCTKQHIQWKLTCISTPLKYTPFIEIRKSTNLPDEATSRHQLAERPPEITGRTSSATMWNYKGSVQIVAEVETFKVTHRSASDRIWKSSKMCDPEIATDPRWFLQHRMVYTALMGFFKFGTSSDKCYQLNQGVRQSEKRKRNRAFHMKKQITFTSLSAVCWKIGDKQLQDLEKPPTSEQWKTIDKSTRSCLIQQVHYV